MPRISPTATSFGVWFSLVDASGTPLAITGTPTALLYQNGAGIKNASVSGGSGGNYNASFTALSGLTVGGLLQISVSWTSGGSSKSRFLDWSGWVDRAPLTAAEIEDTIAAAVTEAINSGGEYPITWPLTDTEPTMRELVRRDDYSGDRVIQITVATSEDLTGATLAFGAGRDGQTIAGTVAIITDHGDGTYLMGVTITAAEMTKPVGVYGWDITAKLAAGASAGAERTLRRGRFRLLEKYAAAA